MTCLLVLDHVEDLVALLCELKRICRDDGAIVLSVMHPAMMLRGVQARFSDPESGPGSKAAASEGKAAAAADAELARLRAMQALALSGPSREPED